MFEKKEDRYFYFISGIIGSISEYHKELVPLVKGAGFNMNIIQILPAIIQAGIVAFIAGFLGVLGKKAAVGVYNFIFRRGNKK